MECHKELSADQIQPPSLLVMGGGLAGLSAAIEAKRKGFRVRLVERGRFLGGRTASLSLSLPNAKPDCLVDNGQHLFFGCCKSLRRFNSTAGLNDCFDRSNKIVFILPDGQRWSLFPRRWLPQSMRYLPSLLSIPSLSWSERFGIASTCRKLVRVPDGVCLNGSFRQWLSQQHVSDRTIDQFWKPVILSALAELPEYVSIHAAKAIVQEGFFSGSEGLTSYLPNRPLREIYHDRMIQYCKEHEIEVSCLTRINRLFVDDHHISGVEFADGTRDSFDRYVVAMGPFATARLLNESEMEPELERIRFDRFELGSITAVHLWFNQRILDETAALLPGSPGQWLFCPKSQSQYPSPSGNGIYHQIMISGSHRLLEGEELTTSARAGLVDRVMKQLTGAFPHLGSSSLVHYSVSTVLDAIVSPAPDIFYERPSQHTYFDNMVLAGDWTQTLWPSTMEGAVQSGIEAVRFL